MHLTRNTHELDMETAGVFSAIEGIERATSVLSMLGCLFIILTFCLSASFHKPINRLVFYTAIGNMLCNVATLMSRSYVNHPMSTGCQAQAFLIQWFMPADTCWALAMAVNVYLTFYRRFDTESLRRLEPYYLLACYGVPFIPALAFLFLKNSNGDAVYGDAVLWCWISKEWNIWRIAAFYGPVWVAIVFIFVIYIRVGVTIYNKKRQLYKFSSDDGGTLTQEAGEPQVANGDVTKVTEVTVTSATVPDSHPSKNSRSDSTQAASTGSDAAYSVDVFAGPHAALPANAVEEAPSAGAPTVAEQRKDARARKRSDQAAFTYTKCAMLFFAAMLITWIPSSANRFVDLIYQKASSPLEVMSAFVLPLQGLWNAVIYISTSRAACRELFIDLRPGRRPHVTEIVGTGENDQHSAYSMGRVRRGLGKQRVVEDNDSTASFAREGAGSVSSRQ